MLYLLVSLIIIITILLYFSRKKKEHHIGINKESLNLNHEELYKEAKQLYELGDNEKAIQCCTEALELEEKPSYYHLRGISRSPFFDADNAIRDLTKAIELEPRAEYFFARAKVQDKKRHYSEAIQDYTKAIEIESKSEYFIERAMSKAFLHDMSGALSDCSKAIKIEPKAQYYINRAGLKYDMDFDAQSAFEDCDKAVEIEPNSQAYYFRGLYREEFDSKGSIDDYSKAIEIEPKSEYFLQRGIALRENKNFESALKDFNKSINLDSNLNNHIERGECYGLLGREDLKYKDFQIALGLSSNAFGNSMQVRKMKDFCKSFADKNKKKANVKAKKKKKKKIERTQHNFTNLDENSINYIDFYHPFRHGSNDNFNEFSSLILDLKDGDELSIDYFFNRCLSWLNGRFDAIVCVPSHNPSNTHSGIRELAHKIAINKEWNDASNCLKRIHKIDKLSAGGNRSIDIHLKSISIQNQEKILGKKVILIDDISTTGNSLLASRKILKEAGACKVYMCALGKTSH